MACLTTLSLNLSDCENKGQKVTFPKDFPWGHSLGINWVIQKVALTLLLVDLGLGIDPHLLTKSRIGYPTAAVRKHRDRGNLWKAYLGLWFQRDNTLTCSIQTACQGKK